MHTNISHRRAPTHPSRDAMTSSPTNPPSAPPLFNPLSRKPAFLDLPGPFFSDLAYLLSISDQRGTLASLNQICKLVNEMTLGGLWRSCSFNVREGFDVQVVKGNKMLCGLIR